MKAAKDKWIDDRCIKIELGMGYKRCKVACNTTKRVLIKRQHARESVIEHKNGNMILTEEVEENKRWSKYCEESSPQIRHDFIDKTIMTTRKNELGSNH